MLPSSYKGKETDQVSAFLLRTLSGRNNNLEDDDNVVFLRNPSALPRKAGRACILTLVIMHNKVAVGPLNLLRVFFCIMVTARDKKLGNTLYLHVVGNVRNVNKKGCCNDALNWSVQALLYKVTAETAQQQQNKAP